jgi:hypothetical protein
MRAEDQMGGIKQKQMKTAKLGIVLQMTEVHGQKDDRMWEVHDVERNRGFKVMLSARALKETPSGEKAKTRAEKEIEGAIGLAIEHFLKASPELVAGGPLYEVQVTSRDLYEYAKLHP